MTPKLRALPGARLLRWTLLLVLLPASTSASAAAQGRSYHIEEFHSTIEVRRDGSMEVRERIRFRFDGAFNGIYRTLPVEYRTPRGFRYKLYVSVESVADESGTSLRYEESREGGYRKLKVWVPGARDAARTVAIRYTVENGIRFFEEGEAEGFSDAHDELYWNVTGDEWEVPIHAASARIEFPEGVEGLKATGFTGSYGSREKALEVRKVEDGFFFRTTRRLDFQEGLTVVTAWDPGVVDRPGIVKKAGFFFRANWILLFPLLATAVMGWLWHTRGRDPALRPIMPEYQPPEGLSPGTAGTLIDDRPDTRDIVATLVDLAVRGYLSIEELETNPIKELFTGPDYRFHREKDASEWDRLLDHEREVLVGIFGTGGGADVVDLSELKNEFYEHIEDIKDHIFRRLMDLGFYHKRPDKVKRLYIATGIAFVVLAVMGFQLAGLLIGAVSPLSFIVAALGTAIPVLGFGYFMPARTAKGTRTLETVLGFEDFLDRVEEDRFERMLTSPDLFEKYLPYAMALGVDESWARAFEDLVTDPPEWYRSPRGPGHFHTTTFVHDMGNLRARAGSVMTSAPRSSSSGSSGFGGGGFSGGGFGGGGGGAF